MSSKRVLGVVGAGMILADQVLWALLELLRRGVFSELHMAAQGSKSLNALVSHPRFARDYPDFNPRNAFTSYPPLDTDSSIRSDRYFLEMFDAMPPGSVVFVAIPDALHARVILEALKRGLHVVSVKSLCTSSAELIALRDAAHQRGLFVGVEYHKMADTRVQIARRNWQSGQFGVMVSATATMIEDDSYMGPNSPFAAHFVPATSDPATYVGCHYIQQVHYITGERPIAVSVYGVRGRFVNGPECVSWATSNIHYPNAGMVMVNGLGFPGHAAMRNHQGLQIFGVTPGGKGTFLCHVDNNRGMYYATDPDRGGRVTDAGTDYIGWVPRREGPGGMMIGYGYESVRELVTTAFEVAAIQDLDARRSRITTLDAEYNMATLGNTGWCACVYEAMRASVLDRGKVIEVDYSAVESS